MDDTQNVNPQAENEVVETAVPVEEKMEEATETPVEAPSTEAPQM